MTLEQLLAEIENKILTIKKRLYFLKAILGEIEKVTGGKKFNIKNDVIWQMMSDSYEMLIIDLASLYRGMCESGGFFGKLKHFSPTLRKKSHRSIEVGEPTILQHGKNMTPADLERVKKQAQTELKKLYAQGIEEALLELFPELKEAQDKKANHDHIEALKDRFWNLNVELVRERDNFSAHRYESKNDSFENLKRIGLPAVEAHFQRLEKMMNAIRLVAFNSTFSYSNMNLASSPRAAEDIVDLLMNGSFNNVFNKFGISEELNRIGGEPPYYYLFRENFYKKNPQPYSPNKEDDSDSN
jgi:hypothetical protein